MQARASSTYFSRVGVKLEPDALLQSVISEFHDIGSHVFNHQDILRHLGSDVLPAFARNLNTLIYRYNENRLRLASQKQHAKELRDENETLEMKYAQIADEYSELAKEYEASSRFCMQAEAFQKQQQTKIALLEEKCDRLSQQIYRDSERPSQSSEEAVKRAEQAEKDRDYYRYQLTVAESREKFFEDEISELRDVLVYYREITVQTPLKPQKKQVERIENIKDKTDLLPPYVVLETTFDKGTVAVLDGVQYRIYDELAQSQFVCAHCYSHLQGTNVLVPAVFLEKNKQWSSNNRAHLSTCRLSDLDKLVKKDFSRGAANKKANVSRSLSESSTYQLEPTRSNVNSSGQRTTLEPSQVFDDTRQEILLNCRKHQATHRSPTSEPYDEL